MSRPSRNPARDRWESVTTWPLLTASVLFLIAYSWVVLEPTMPTVLAVTLWIVLGLVWIAFLIDYVVRVALSADKWDFVNHNKVDLLSVLLPLARPFRLLKYLGRLPLLGGNSGAALRRRVIVIAATFIVMFIYVISLAEFAAERYAPHALITSFGDSVWWACVTMATVGYGDYYPITVPGRILAVILMIGGVVIVGTASATVVSFLGERMTAVRSHHPAPARAPHLELDDPNDSGEASSEDERPDV